jgi:hypothetical protein
MFLIMKQAFPPSHIATIDNCQKNFMRDDPNEARQFSSPLFSSALEKLLGAGRVAQVLECLPSKCKP